MLVGLILQAGFQLSSYLWINHRVPMLDRCETNDVVRMFYWPVLAAGFSALVCVVSAEITPCSPNRMPLWDNVRATILRYSSCESQAKNPAAATPSRSLVGRENGLSEHNLSFVSEPPVTGVETPLPLERVVEMRFLLHNLCNLVLLSL